MTLSVEVAGKTDPGRVRANNEDNFGYDSRYGIFVLCDGMGGQAAGEVASKMGVDILLDYFRHDSGSEPYPGNGQPPAEAPGGLSPAARSLDQAIHLANHKIYEAGQQEKGRSGMGSTIVAVVIRGHALAIGNVGDSRIYLVRQGEIQQLTEDHSLVMEQVRQGYITREQAQQSDMQNVILRALGCEEELEVDVEDLVAMPGDLILMTSDGLTRHLDDQEILKIITASSSLEHTCSGLIQAANQRGGEDNITCLLLKIVEQPWYRAIFNQLFSGGQQWQNSI
jgi:serine/threonine protein phosphatase PrpC